MRKWCFGWVWLCAVGLAGAQVPARLSEADVRHLLARTGFAASPSEVRPWVGMAPAEAVDRLLADAAGAVPGRPAPAFTREPPRAPYAELPDEAARWNARLRAREDTRALAVWWLGEMRRSPTPLAERMVLFWHGHFATSEQKVQQPQGMFVQHQLFRRHALGSFRDLLHAVVRDPALLIYLDGQADGGAERRFARDVMALFTLGEGHYDEGDVEAASRAFTGWTVRRVPWEAVFQPARFDGGTKVLFGQPAPYDMASALDRMLAQPAAARFIVAKLWHEFVSTEPDPAVVDTTAAAFRASGWRTDVVLRRLLTSDAFWAPAARGALVKSPVELAVGALRQFDVAMDDLTPLDMFVGSLGQSLFEPPGPGGWRGYSAWIDSLTLPVRQQFGAGLLRLREEEGASGAVRFDARAWLASVGAEPERVPDDRTVARLRAAVLLAPPADRVPAGTPGLPYLRALATDPMYQLK